MFYIDVRALCDRSIYFIHFKLYVYYYDKSLINVIPLPNKFNFVIAFLCLCCDDLLLDNNDDYSCKNATLLNYYDCDDNFILVFIVKGY